MTRSQAKKQVKSEIIDLDQSDDPTASAACAMLGLKNQRIPRSPSPCEKDRA